MFNYSINSRGINEDYTWFPSDVYSRPINKIAKSEMSECLVLERRESGLCSLLLGGFVSPTRKDRTGTPIRDSILFEGLKENQARALAVLFFLQSDSIKEMLERGISLDKSDKGWRFDSKIIDGIAEMAFERKVANPQVSDESWWRAFRYSNANQESIARNIKSNNLPDQSGFLIVYSKYLSSEETLNQIAETAICICSNAVVDEFLLSKKKHHPQPLTIPAVSVSLVDLPGSWLLKLLEVFVPDWSRSQKTQNSWLIKPRSLGIIFWIAILILTAILRPTGKHYPEPRPEKKKRRRQRSW